MAGGVQVVDVSDDPLVLMEPLTRALAGGPPVLPRLSPGPAPRRAVSADTVLVVETSGSTGTPKLVEISGPALIAAATAATTRLGGSGHWLLATPVSFIGGIGVLTRTALNGTEIVVTERGAGFRPELFATAGEKLLGLTGRHFTSLVPTQLRRILADPAAVAVARELDGMLIGGAPLTEDLRHAALAAGLPVIGAYGLSETSGGCVYDGLPLDGVRIRINAEDRIEVAGPLLATGYLGRPDLTERTFRGGWLRTGDLGRWSDGVLTVLGRADDVIITGGVKVAPEPTEGVLRSVPGVAQVCVLGVPDAEWGQRVTAVVVPVDQDNPPDVETMRATVRRQLTAAATPRRVIFADSLPLRGAGKIDRVALRKALSTEA